MSTKNGRLLKVQQRLLPRLRSGTAGVLGEVQVDILDAAWLLGMARAAAKAGLEPSHPDGLPKYLKAALEPET